MKDNERIAKELSGDARLWDMGGRLDSMIELVREYIDHQSVRCGWPKAYEQWVDGHCACGLTEALDAAGLPIEWAGGPPDGDDMAEPRSKADRTG